MNVDFTREELPEMKVELQAHKSFLLQKKNFAPLDEFVAEINKLEACEEQLNRAIRTK